MKCKYSTNEGQWQHSVYALTGAIIYDAVYTVVSELSVVEKQAQKTSSNDGFSVTIQAMLCQRTLNPSF